MARQRFIWPSMWTDKDFGTLKSDEKVLYIGLFSLADDAGRINSDPMYLRAQIFPYEKFTVKRVRAMRDAVVRKMPQVWFYESDGDEFIALLKWSDYQKPKYPKPSKIPEPFPESSRNVPEAFPPRVGLGREGLGSALGTSTESVTKAVSEARPDARDEPADDRPPHTDDDAPEPEANGLGDFESVGQIIEATLGKVTR